MAEDAPMLHRCLRHILAIACCLLMLPAFGAVSNDSSGIMAGTVKDVVGNLIEGAEILIAAETGSMLPIARVRSDAQGRVRLPDLAVGVYRFAALKDGYRTAVGSFQTEFQPWFEVVLHPMPDSEEVLQHLPKSSDWVLRVPRRSVFRETDAPRPVFHDASGPRDSSAIADQLSLQFRHLMAWNAPGGEGDDIRTDAATQTQLRLASAVGQRGRLSLVGNKDREAAPMSDTLPGDRNAAGLAVDFEYATTPDTQMRIEAFYRSEDFSWNDPATGNIGAPVQEGRAWGYGSEWSMQLDAASRVDLRLDYENHSIQNQPDSLASIGKPGFGPGVGENTVNQRAVRASGFYSSAALAGHQLQVGVQAQHLDSALERLPRVEAGALGAVEGIAGWSLAIDAEDRWALSAPFTLVYGLGYKHAVDPVDTSLLVPRIGGRLSLEPVAVGFAVSYHVVSAWEDEAALALWSSPMESDGRVGYTVDAEVPLADSLEIRAKTSYSPIQMDARNASWNPSAWADRPLYRTDGNAEVHETSLGLHRDSAQARTYVEFSSGYADGMVNAVRPQQDLYRWLTPSSLRFREGRVGVRLVPSGTDVRLEYSHVRENGVSGVTGLDRVQDSVELRVIQDLLRFEALGRWRLLMAFRLDALEDEVRSDELELENELLSAENRAVRAGLSVTF